MDRKEPDYGQLCEGKLICERSILGAIRRSKNNSKKIKSEKEKAEAVPGGFGAEEIEGAIGGAGGKEGASFGIVG